MERSGSWATHTRFRGLAISNQRSTHCQHHNRLRSAVNHICWGVYWVHQIFAHNISKFWAWHTKTKKKISLKTRWRRRDFLWVNRNELWVILPLSCIVTGCPSSSDDLPRRRGRPRSAPGRPRFDPTEYIRQKKEKEHAVAARLRRRSPSFGSSARSSPAGGEIRWACEMLCHKFSPSHIEGNNFLAIHINTLLLWTLLPIWKKLTVWAQFLMLQRSFQVIKFPRHASILNMGDLRSIVSQKCRIPRPVRAEPLNTTQGVPSAPQGEWQFSLRKIWLHALYGSRFRDKLNFWCGHCSVDWGVFWQRGLTMSIVIAVVFSIQNLWHVFTMMLKKLFHTCQIMLENTPRVSFAIHCWMSHGTSSLLVDSLRAYSCSVNPAILGSLWSESDSICDSWIPNLDLHLIRLALQQSLQTRCSSQGSDSHISQLTTVQLAHWVEPNGSNDTSDSR